jgi:hypothetical protein
MTEYAIDLGNGSYLSPSGEITSAPAWIDYRTPVFEVPGGSLPINPAAWHDAVKEVEDALKSLSDPKDGGKTLMKLGVTEDTLKLLGTAAQIAGTIATITGVVGIAFKLASAIGLLRLGPDPLEALVDRRFNELRQQVRSLEEQLTKKDIRNLLEPFKTATNQAYQYNDTLDRYPRADHGAASMSMRLRRDGLPGALTLLLSSATWEATFYADDYKDPDLIGCLVQGTYSSAGGTDRRVTFPQADLVSRFDHRLLVPAVTHAVQSYLLVCRTVLPEFRSTGDYYHEMKDAAAGLLQLARRMRSESLGRTRFTEDDFSRPLWIGRPPQNAWPQDVDESPTGALTLRKQWHLGAVDLCAYTNSVLIRQWTDARRLGIMDRVGTMELWAPLAAQLDRAVTQCYITNPDECARDANAASEREYARLLSFSGYTHLLLLTALLRLNAAQPNRSETVTGMTFTGRKVTETQPTVVRSPQILFTGVIESPATLTEQRFRATLSIDTQPIGRDRPLRYRIMLRTLRSYSGDDRVWEWPYSAYHAASYQADPADPDFLVLRTDTNDQVRISELELLKWTASPDHRVERSGVAHLTANTFDLYVPEAPLSRGPEGSLSAVLGRLGPPSKPGAFDAARLGSETGAEETSGPESVLASTTEGSAIAGAVSGIEWLGFDSEPSLEQAQQRHSEHRPINLAWELAWRGSRLEVELESEPIGRNYVVYLVVEEMLEVPNRNILHTAFRVGVNTALTIVPASFFEQEQEAYERAREILSDLARRYVEVAEVKPGDRPKVHIHPGDLRTMEGIGQTLEQLRKAKPAIDEEIARMLEGPVKATH